MLPLWLYSASSASDFTATPDDTLWIQSRAYLWLVSRALALVECFAIAFRAWGGDASELSIGSLVAHLSMTVAKTGNSEPDGHRGCEVLRVP